MGPNLAPKSAADADVEVPALVIAYCHSEPDRVGEVALFPKLHAPMVLGRKAGEDPAEPRVTFHRQRPGELVAMPPLEGETLSRRQLVITARPFGFEVENVGRGELLVNGEPAARHLVPSGGTIQVAGALVLYCTSRPLALAPGELAPAARGAFGEPDRFGIAGESPVAWELVDQLVLAGRATGAALVRGPTGSQKELAARAVHALGARPGGPFVARTGRAVATALASAELFGNAKDQPRAGTPAAPGALAEAAGGALFVDDLADLPPEALERLLRFVETGEYCRVGESAVRRGDARVVAATSRPFASLGREPASRFASHVLVPALEARPEDIPLLVRQLVLRFAERDAVRGERFITKGPDGRLEAKVEPALVDALLRHEYASQVDGLEKILTTAMRGSKRTTLLAYPDLIEKSSRQLPVAVAVDDEDGDPVPQGDEARLRALMGGSSRYASVAIAATALGVTRRQVYRLMRKYGI